MDETLAYGGQSSAEPARKWVAEICVSCGRVPGHPYHELCGSCVELQEGLSTAEGQPRVYVPIVDDAGDIARRMREIRREEKRE